ncbi:FAD-binding protein [Chloroflexota bacterium]
METEAKKKDELEADVVVVGYGGAGAAAAITAHDNGARVIIVEKMPSGGGNTRISGGGLFKPLSMEYVRYLEALSLGTTEKEILEAFVQTAIQLEDWIHNIGGELEHRAILQATYPPMPSGVYFPKVPGSEHAPDLLDIQGDKTNSGGERLWKLLSTNVEQRGIKVIADAPAKELVTNDKGEVEGVIAENNGGKILVRARKAVILTCGGFEYNEAMKNAFLFCRPFVAFGNPSHTGDGIVMAQKAGAALWHMAAATGYLGFKAPEYEAAFAMRFHSERFIHVNREGKRFCDETGLEHHHGWMAFSQVDAGKGSSHPGYPNIPIFSIFDEEARRRGPLYRRVETIGFNRNYKWSLDNSEEIARGWISRGKTIRDLAHRISVDESSLESTVARYNEYCQVGRDDEFSRSKETLGPIETPPFYAIELWPGLVSTRGGPRRDKQARVLDYEGKPIPRLYAAGELGSVMGLLYSVSSLTECLAFGRIAGRNAAAEKPWS